MKADVLKIFTIIKHPINMKECYYRMIIRAMLIIAMEKKHMYVNFFLPILGLSIKMADRTKHATSTIEMAVKKIYLKS